MKYIKTAILGLITAGIIVFSLDRSIKFVMSYFGNDPTWIIVAVCAIAIEIFMIIAIVEMFKSRNYFAGIAAIPVLMLAVLLTVSFEIGNFATVASDTVAARQFEIDKFNDNRLMLRKLRADRERYLKKGWPNTAANINKRIKQAESWTVVTRQTSTADPRSLALARLTGLDVETINVNLMLAIVLFLHLVMLVCPVLSYRMMAGPPDLPGGVTEDDQDADFTNLFDGLVTTNGDLVTASDDRSSQTAELLEFTGPSYHHLDNWLEQETIRVIEPNMRASDAYDAYVMATGSTMKRPSFYSHVRSKLEPDHFTKKRDGMYYHITLRQEPFSVGRG